MPYAPAPKARPYMDEIETPPGRLRIGFCTENVNDLPLHADVQATFDATVKLLGELGHTLIEKPKLGVNIRKLYKAQGFVSGAMAVVGYEEWAEKMQRPLDESTLEWLALIGYRGAKEIPAKDVAWGLQTIRAMGREILSLYRDFDVLLQPMTITPAPPLGFLDPMNVRAREFNQRQGRTFGLTPARQPDRTAGHVGAAGPVEREQPAHRHDVLGPLWRRGDVVPAGGATGTGGALDRPQAAGMGLSGPAARSI